MATTPLFLRRVSVMLTQGPPFRVQFYSWYIYPEREEDLGKSVSSAAYIEDVNQVRLCHPFDLQSMSLTIISIGTGLGRDHRRSDQELAASWLACVLGCGTEEPRHCVVAIRYVEMRACLIPFFRIFIVWLTNLAFPRLFPRRRC